MSDILADNNVPVVGDDLVDALRRLEEQGHIGTDLVREAGNQRALAIIPANPPATREEATTLLGILEQLVARLYRSTSIPDVHSDAESQSH